jgi:hypothetical protein
MLNYVKTDKIHTSKLQSFDTILVQVLHIQETQHNK